MSASPQQGDDTAARIGERLASLRADRGLRVAELARRAGVSPSLVSQIERGQSRPSVTTLVALADGVPHELHEGDSMQFPSSADHRYVNPTDEEARGVGARVYAGRPA